MDKDRYIRQTSLSGFGTRSQERLGASRVLIVGLGGLGIPAAQYLNAMGVGTIGLAEQDRIELHNLQRQVLYTESDLGRPKLEVAAEFLKGQNSTSSLILHDTYLNRHNALEIMATYDVILDATDNFPTRYLINDASVILGKPFVYGALHGFEGQVSVFNWKGGPTYRCLFPKMPTATEVPDCNVNGVLGVLPGIVGNLQALETIKLLTGIGQPLSGQLLIYDGLEQTIRKMRFSRHPERSVVRELLDNYEGVGCGTAENMLMEDFTQLLQRNPGIQVLDVRTIKEYKLDHISGAINIPLNELPSRLAELNRNAALYIVCATGIRSKKAQNWLIGQGWESPVLNIAGGMQRFRETC